MRDLSSMVGGGKVGVGVTCARASYIYIYIYIYEYMELTKSNLQKIDPHTLNEARHVLLERGHNFVPGPDVFEKRL